MDKIYVLTNKSLDTAVAATVAAVVFQKAGIEYGISSFSNNDDFEYLISDLLNRYSGFKLFILGIKPQKELADMLSEAKHIGKISHLEMYNQGSSGIYTDWSHDSKKTVSEQFIANGLIEDMAGKADPATHRMLSSLINALVSCDSEYRELLKIYDKGHDYFVSRTSGYILGDAKESCKTVQVYDNAPRYIHFTHSDMDAAGCCVLLDTAYNLGGNAYEHRFCKNPTDCADQIKEFLSELDDKTEYNVLISDISIKDETVADELNAAFKSGKIANLHLYDHHPTAKWMEKYPWCKIEISHINKEDGKEVKTCGTELLYDYFEDITRIFVTRPMIDVLVAAYVEIVRLYDTYDWKQFGDYGKIAYNHNTIFNRYGISRYTTLMATKLSTGNDVRQFSNEQKEIIAEEDAKFEAHLKECRKLLTVRSDYIDGIGVFKYGALFCSKYTSETGNRLSVEHPELAFILMVNTEKMKVEIRTARDDFDTSEFAKINGGGGHPKASGFPLEYKDLADMVKALRA